MREFVPGMKAELIAGIFKGEKVTISRCPKSRGPNAHILQLGPEWALVWIRFSNASLWPRWIDVDLIKLIEVER